MSKIGKVEWVFLYAFMGAIDVIQWIIDFFAVGVVINSFADPLIGVCLAGYFQIRGVSMIKHPTRLLSLLGVAGLETITGGLAPAWFIDIWYIQRTVKKEDAEANAQKKQDELLQNNIRRPAYTTDANGNAVRLPPVLESKPTSRPANTDGIRSPNGGLR